MARSMEHGLPQSAMAPDRFLLLIGFLCAVSQAIPDRTLSMVDEHHVLYKAGLHRVLQPLNRRGAVLSPDRPYEELLGYVSPHWVGEELWLWYQCYSQTMPAITNSTVGVCLATSQDGINFTKPNRDVYAGTNIVFSPSPAFYFGDILYEPADANTPFKMAFWDMQTGGNKWSTPGLYTATSTDGVHWTQVEPRGHPAVVGAYGNPGAQPPFVSANPTTAPDSSGNWQTELSQSDAINLMFDTTAQEYRVYAKTWIDGIDGAMFWKRAVMLHTSKDFKQWAPLPGHLCVYPDEYDTGTNPVTAAPYLPGTGANGVELHAGPVAALPASSLHVMLIQHLDWSSKPNSGNLEMELAISRNGGTEWTRPFRSHLGYPKLLASNPVADQFDSGTLWTNAHFVEHGDSRRLYYGAYRSWSDADGHTGVGMAEMLTDRFAALVPMNASYPAQVTLKAVNLTDVCSITINVDATVEGSAVRVELLSGGGYVIDGFSQLNASVVTNTSSVAVPVRWESGKLPLEKGQADAVIVRAHFVGQPKVYALSLHGCV